MNLTCPQRLQDLAQKLFDKKAMNLMALDMRHLSALSDFLLIAEGNVSRHVRALSKEIEKLLKEQGLAIASIESDTLSDWIVIDAYDIIIHIFTPDVRRYYALEQFWSEAHLVELDLEMKEGF